MIAIIDYGMGNLRSVQKAFEALGYSAIITSDVVEIDSSSHIVLPGVGAFSEAISHLNNSGLRECIVRNINCGKPFLGICLGMQMLFEYSYEDGKHQGMGVLSGSVLKFDIDLKVPHIGWNEVKPCTKSVLFEGIDDKYFYFVHSYCVGGNNPYRNATCDYGVDFTCSVEKDKIFGVQFHPEKSGDSGLKLLDNFVKLTN